MIQVNAHDSRVAALEYVRLAFAVRQSNDDRKRGGDFLVYHLHAGRLTLAIGDVSLKESQGVQIARLLRRNFRVFAHESGPSRILTAMSDALVEQAGLRMPSPTFAAVFVATIDLTLGVLSYAAAGVEGGMIFGGRPAHVHLGATGPLLGIEEHPVFEERAMRFLPGDSLVAYTDGVTEARAAGGTAPFGSSGMVLCMSDVQRAGEPTIRALWRKIGQFTGRTYHDDATLAIVTTPKARPTVLHSPRQTQPAETFTAVAI